MLRFDDYFNRLIALITNMHRWNKWKLAFIVASILLIVVLVRIPAFNDNNNDFVTFRETAVTNADFSKVITWAGGLLLSTANFPETNTEILNKDIPPEVKNLFCKREAEPWIAVGIHTYFESGVRERFGEGVRR
jgi:hypothetical protein